MNFQKLFFVFVIVLCSNSAFAQADSNIATQSLNITIPNIALVDLEVTGGGPVPTITLAGTAPIEAGLPMTFEDATAKNATIYMNYSSIVTGSTLRNVTAKIAGLPAGLKLTVEAATYAGIGKGTTGTSSGVITLDGTEKSVVTGIGSAYTGNVDNGHLLTYQLGLSGTATDYADLRFATDVAATITYTLSDI